MAFLGVSTPRETRKNVDLGKVEILELGWKNTLFGHKVFISSKEVPEISHGKDEPEINLSNLVVENISLRFTQDLVDTFLISSHALRW